MTTPQPKMLSLKKLKVVSQKRSSTCGPAALRTLLLYFGIDRSEGYLARLCQTTQRWGTHPEQLVKALNKLGFQTKTGSGAGKEKSWRTLSYWVNKRGLPVIVDWFSETDGHYSVVYGLTKTDIWLADPEFHRRKDRKRKMPWKDFVRVWFDFEGEYINRLKDMEIRWWLVAYPAPLKK